MEFSRVISLYIHRYYKWVPLVDHRGKIVALKLRGIMWIREQGHDLRERSGGFNNLRLPICLIELSSCQYVLGMRKASVLLAYCE